MKVLIGADGSAGSFAAVQLADQLLSAANDEIILYYGPPQVIVSGREQPDEETLERAQQALASAVFDETKQRISVPMQARVTTIVGSSDPAHDLLETAAEVSADMIAVGARGVGPIKRILLGSVSRSVVHHSTLPVLVARPRGDETLYPGLRVLFACDGTDTSEQAANQLNRFTWTSGSVGRVVTVVESIYAGHLPDWLQQQALESETELLPKAWVEENETHRLEVQAEMTEYCGKLPDIFSGQRPIVVEGHATEQILATIAAQHPDLVVVGARGLGPLSRLLIGSTSEALLGHAPCSVLVVPKATD